MIPFDRPITKCAMQYVDITLLKPAEYNPRRMGEDKMQELIQSILAFGFIDPIIANKDFTVIGGHQRLKAAQRLSFTEVPVVFLDLSKNDEKALNLALNKTGGEFEKALLAAVLETLPDEQRKVSGFSDAEIEKALAIAVKEQKKPKEEPAQSADVMCPTCGQLVTSA